MTIPQHQKELAYRIDPDCWVSYSGQPKSVKQAMDARRTASLAKAETLHRERSYAKERRDHFQAIRDQQEQKFRNVVDAIESFLDAKIKLAQSERVARISVGSSFRTDVDETREHMRDKLRELVP